MKEKSKLETKVYDKLKLELLNYENWYSNYSRYNYLETDNKWQTLLGCITAKIKSTNLNGKECYIVKDFLSSTSLTSEGAETYIDKETGLFLQTTKTEIITERDYEFYNVEDSIFIEPDISQYTLK